MTALGTFLLVVAKSKALVVCWVGQGSYLVKKKKKRFTKNLLSFLSSPQPVLSPSRYSAPPHSLWNTKTLM